MWNLGEPGTFQVTLIQHPKVGKHKKKSKNFCALSMGPFGEQKSAMHCAAWKCLKQDQGDSTGAKGHA